MKEYKTIENTIRGVVSPTPMIVEDHDDTDLEGQMAMSQLMSISRRAQRIAEMIKPDTQLDAWVQSKLTMAEDYITTVYDYLRNTPNQIKEQSNMKDNSKFGSSQSLIDAVNEVLKGGQKKLDKNHNGKLDGEDFKKLRGENEVDEVAASKTQQRAAGAALATQRGEYDGGKKGGAINRMSAMKPSDLMKIAGTKTKELPMRKEEAEQADEGAFSSGALKASEKFKREAKKIQSTGTYIGKDSKGVFTSKTARINGVNKEISRTYENAVMKAIKSIREMKADISESGHTLQYSGSVNKKEYKLPVSGGKELDDYSDTGLHRLLRKHNPHLEHHEVSAIVNSGGQDETKETVVHKGKSYTHDVVNHQEPRRLESIGEMKADISESGGTLEYSGSVNKKEYKLPVSGGKELDDYSDTGLHRLLRKHNPHLEHHEVSAIVNSGGQDETKETVVHKGKSYTHDVVNHQEPRRLD